MPRPRKPAAIHFLQDTTPKYEPAEPMFRAGRPKMPDGLSEIERVEWLRLTRELRKRGTLTRADSPSLELYVKIFGRWKRCLASLEQSGDVVEVEWVDAKGIPHTKPVEHPASKLCTRLESALCRMLKEFSATPASRDKTKPAARPAPAPKGPEPGSEEDILRQLAAVRSLPDEEPESLTADDLNQLLDPEGVVANEQGKP